MFKVVVMQHDVVVWFMMVRHVIVVLSLVSIFFFSDSSCWADVNHIGAKSAE